MSEATFSSRKPISPKAHLTRRRVLAAGLRRLCRLHIAALREGKAIWVALLVYIACWLDGPALSRRAASLLSLVLALLYIKRRANRERARATHPAAPPAVATLASSSSDVLFVGDAGVGKSALIAALRPRLAPHLTPHEPPPGVDAASAAPAAALVCIVWTADCGETMTKYAARHWRAAAGGGRLDATGRRVPLVVICNKTDVTPCPLPQINSMIACNVPCLAVSASRGTNLAALSHLIEQLSPPPPPPTLPTAASGDSVASTPSSASLPSVPSPSLASLPSVPSPSLASLPSVPSPSLAAAASAAEKGEASPATPAPKKAQSLATSSPSSVVCTLAAQDSSAASLSSSSSPASLPSPPLLLDANAARAAAAGAAPAAALPPAYLPQAKPGLSKQVSSGLS